MLYALNDGKPHLQKEICEHWLVPKTTINTNIRECVNAGYIVLDVSNHTKEKEIRLTVKGQEYTRTIMNQVYELERRDMEKTLASYSPEFVQAIEQFTAYLKEETEHFSYGE